MGGYKDLVGLRFGRLVVAEKLGANKRQLMTWRCVCDCGGETVSVTGNLNSGNTISCGCIRRENLDRRNHIDLVGQTFGRLTVIEKLHSNHRQHIVWACSCICGGATEVTTGNLNKGDVRSCGCLRVDTAAAMGAACKQDNPISRTKEYRRDGQRRRLADPNTRMRRRLSWHIRRAVNKVGDVKRGRAFEMLGYSPKELVRHIERQFTRGMGWHNVTQWDIDHIIPISSAKTLGDVIALNQMTNLRPMWREENNAKRAKVLSLL